MPHIQFSGCSTPITKSKLQCNIIYQSIISVITNHFVRKACYGFVCYWDDGVHLRVFSKIF